ncbi:putative peptide ABC transporter permease [Actinacidiphila reveromycinica]|uniref:Putative peptide ABC transporter permease n=1 Tax=Actinacidiphila reveromycinica TaxID=659352 RepID=A0A7U3UZB4_9ACTN|nr:ABC transporter permease [Streptomyces sp. SN-593]BBB01475.1 putative peptide ABC transporter permease [Streptomyces sp. SN-593]
MRPLRLPSATRPRTRRFSYRRLFFGNLATGVGTVCGLVVLVFVTVVPLLSPYDPTRLDASNRLLAPSWSHWLGTDDLGRDVLVRLAEGGRLSLVCAVGAVACAAVLGAVVGALCGYLGGVVDAVLMRVADALQGFPQVLLALLVAAGLGRGMAATTAATAVAYWPYFAKITRGLVRQVRGALYVQAAVAQGAGVAYVLRRHLLPQTATALFTQATMAVGEAIVFISGLSLIGLGAQEPTPEWGLIIAQSAGFVLQAWWYPTFAGLALFLAVLSANLLGDALRENLGFGSGAASRRGIRRRTPPPAAVDETL